MQARAQATAWSKMWWSKATDGGKKLLQLSVCERGPHEHEQQHEGDVADHEELR